MPSTSWLLGERLDLAVEHVDHLVAVGEDPSGLAIA